MLPGLNSMHCYAVGVSNSNSSSAHNISIICIQLGQHQQFGGGLLNSAID